MRTAGKTLATLTKIKRNAQETESSPLPSDPTILEESRNPKEPKKSAPSTHLDQKETIKRNFVEFHPEEVDEYAPLRPEEADDVALAGFFNHHDFSFLFDGANHESRSVQESQSQSRASRAAKRPHVVPADEGSPRPSKKTRTTSHSDVVLLKKAGL